MNNTNKDLRSLLPEIPMVSNADSHEKFKCILMLYSKILVGMFITYKVTDYFKNLHIMSFDIKSIMNKHVSELTRQETYRRTRDMLVKDIYSLVELTEVQSAPQIVVEEPQLAVM